jgi:asparagine synthetase B (glutamine-hydrolysing)
MCGIAGVYLRDPGAKANLDGMLDTMLDLIEHRGGDATGFVAIGDEGVTEWQKAACGAKEFARYRRPVPTGTRTIVAHTRWATQGLPAFVENNHPLRRGSFFVTHNGHVINDSQLFELAGRARYGQVDSEAIPARFASLGKLSAAPKVMSEIQGAAAIAAVDEKKPKELLLARGSSSPLFVLTTKKYVLWGSTRATVAQTYLDHIGRLPKKTKIEEVKEGTVLHFVDGKLTRTKFGFYSPPKIVYSTTGWKSTSTEVDTPASRGWDKTEDMLECDSCGEQEPWQSASYRTSPTSRETFILCEECDALWETVGEELVYQHGYVSFRDEIADAEFTVVNEAVLEED